MIPTIDATKSAVFSMNVIDDDDDDIDDEMAIEAGDDNDEDNNDGDDFWLGKLEDLLEDEEGEEEPEKSAETEIRKGKSSLKSDREANEPEVIIKEEADAAVQPKTVRAEGLSTAEAKKQAFAKKVSATVKSLTQLPQKCPLCAHVFPNLNLHIKNEHGIEGVVCPHCSKILAKNCTLSRHIEQVHFNLQIHKPAKCEECGKIFSKKGHLDRHVKTIHLGIKEASNPCPHCGKVFSTKSSLEPHIMMVHQGIRKKCPECGKVLSDLWKHMRTMHGKYRRKAKISKEEAINMNLVPNTDGKVDINDIDEARAVPTFTAEVDSHRNIEYVKVDAKVKVSKGFSVLKSPATSKPAITPTPLVTKPSRRKEYTPIKIRLPARSDRLTARALKQEQEEQDV